MMGASREFSRAAVPVWGFHEVGRGAQGASRVAPGKLQIFGTYPPQARVSAFCPDSVPQQTTAKCPHDGLSGLEEDRQETE